MKKSEITKVIKETLQEEKPGLWANIRAKRARGEKPAHKNSNAHKDAVAAGKKINAMKEGKGSDLANKIIDLARKAMKNLTDEDVQEFRDYIALAFDLKPESVNEGEGVLYYVGYNKGRGQGKGIFKDPYSSYEEAKKEAEKIEKQRAGSYNMTAYYVADKDGNLVKEPANELLEANINPEAEKLVSSFIMRLAKRYDYGVKDAIYLIQDVIKNIEASGKLNEEEGKSLQDLEMGEKFTFNGSEYTFIELYPELPSAARVVLPNGRKSVVSFGGKVNTGKKAGIGPDYFGQGKGHHID